MFRRRQSVTETISNRDVYVNQRFYDTEELVLHSMNVSIILFTLEEQCKRSVESNQKHCSHLNVWSVESSKD